MIDRLLSVIKLVDPPMSFRFGVMFLGPLPNPIDIRFQKVSGLSATIEANPVEQDGENQHSGFRFPDKVTYENLRLERGLTLLSPLNNQFDKALTGLKMKPATVLVILFGERGIPFSSWILRKAYPVKWSISDFNADSNELVIETMELAYHEFKPIRI